MQYAHIQSLLTHWHNKRYLTWEKCADDFQLAKLKASHSCDITLTMTSNQPAATAMSLGRSGRWIVRSGSRRQLDDDSKTSAEPSALRSVNFISLQIVLLNADVMKRELTIINLNILCERARVFLWNSGAARWFPGQSSWSSSWHLRCQSPTDVTNGWELFVKFPINAHNFDTIPTSSLFLVIKYPS